MGRHTAISWCDNTFNFWTGCAKKSDGCRECYAEALLDGRFGKGRWGPGARRDRTSEANWKKPYAWNREAKRAGVMQTTFVASLSDFMEIEREDLVPWREEAFKVIEECEYLMWLLLTKRPEGFLTHVPEHWKSGWPDHVCAMTTVENQKVIDRLDILRQVPARYRGISCEPLIGEVDLRRYLPIRQTENGLWVPTGEPSDFHWIISGGESGLRRPRPMHPAWPRLLRDQVVAADVAYHMKQWGQWRPVAMPHADHEGRRVILSPDGRLREATWEEVVALAGDDHAFELMKDKKDSGRELDGRLWAEHPFDLRIAA